MTQNEYLKALEDALIGIDQRDKEELMADFREHFDIGRAEGKTEQDITDHLGPVNELIESLDLKRLKGQKHETVEQSSVTQGSIDRVIIEGLHADVTIEASPDDQAHLDYEISKRILGKLSTEVDSHQEGKTFYVKVTSSNKFFNSGLDAVELTVQVPLDIKELICKTVSGDIELKKATSDNLELHSMSGDIEVQQAATKTLKIISISGDITLKQASGILQVKSVSGDIEIGDHDGADLTIETVSGDIDYEGNAQEIRSNTTSGDASFKAESIRVLNANTVSGDVELELNIEKKGLTIAFISNSGELRIGDAEYDTPRHNQTITIGDGSIKVNLKSISGDFSIE